MSVCVRWWLWWAWHPVTHRGWDWPGRQGKGDTAGQEAGHRRPPRPSTQLCFPFRGCAWPNLVNGTQVSTDARPDRGPSWEVGYTEQAAWPHSLGGPRLLGATHGWPLLVAQPRRLPPPLCASFPGCEVGRKAWVGLGALPEVPGKWPIWGSAAPLLSSLVVSHCLLAPRPGALGTRWPAVCPGH